MLVTLYYATNASQTNDLAIRGFSSVGKFALVEKAN